MNAKPNQQQLEAIAAYSSPVARWTVKSGEYDNEADPIHGGYAMIATLENGWTVKVGRYGAILAEAAPRMPHPHDTYDHPAYACDAPKLGYSNIPDQHRGLYILRDEDDEVIASFTTEGEALEYGSRLADAYPDELYTIDGPHAA